MSSWICRRFPILCAPRPAPMGPMGGPIHPDPLMPAGLEWLQDWVTELNNAPSPPSPESLSILAEALLGQGYADEALQISTEMLDHPSEFGIDIDSLTHANFQLIAARSSLALGDVEQTQNLISSLPSQSTLLKAIQWPAP